MNPIRWTILRVRALAGRGALERDMQEEMRQHLEQAAERYAARGLPLGEARSAALREFGNIGSLQEQARDARGGRWLEELAADVRFAVRHFRRKRLAAVTIIAVLALGIGANTAIFSLMQAWFVRPAPAVPDDPSHIRVYGYQQPAKGSSWMWRDFSYPELLALAGRTETFASIAGWVAHDVVLDPGDSIGARGVGAEFVTPDFFATVGAPVLAGPGFARQAPDVADMAAVMSHRTAVDLYGSAERAAGRRIMVNEVPVRIVGVAPPRFQGAIPNQGRPALWIPLSARAEIARLPREWLSDSASLAVFGRLANGVSHDQATSIARQVLDRTLPDSAARAGLSRTAFVTGLRARPPLADDEELVAIGSVVFVGFLMLLVACTNVSAMMVAAAVGRRQEIAVRLSLGASRWRLLRQLVTESALLAVAGGIAGFVLYWWFATWVGKRANTMEYLNLTPDFGTLGFMMAVALGTGILFGLSPALHATRTGVAGALRDSGSGATHRSRLQRAFVGAQIVFSQPLLVLLAVALSAAWIELAPMPPGVSERVVMTLLQPLEETGAAGQRREAVDSLIPRIAVHPEVTGVVPEAAAFAIRTVVAPAPDGSPGVPTNVHLEGAAPGWFALLGVPILLGRDVSHADSMEAEYPVVIGSDLARTLFGAANPIGRVLPSAGSRRDGRDSIGMRVVGIYDAAHPTTRGSAVHRVYTARDKEWRRDLLLVRTRGSAERFIPELRELIRQAAPSLPIGRMATLAHRDAEEKREAMLLAGAVAGAGALALLLASLGLYGVVALAVQQRRREIGIRIAMGALPSRVAGMFVRSGVRVSVIALAIGLPGSLAGFRYLMAAGILIVPSFNVWLVGIGIAVVLLLVASAATWLPARQAGRVDPAMTLRVE